MKQDGNKYVVRNMDTGLVSQKTYYIHQLLHIKDVIKDKSHKSQTDNIGYDDGIEYKSRQLKNKRALKDIDTNNIIGEDMNVNRALRT